MAIKDSTGADTSPKKFAQDYCIRALVEAKAKLENERPANMTDKQYEQCKNQVVTMVSRANKVLGNLLKE